MTEQNIKLKRNKDMPPAPGGVDERKMQTAANLLRRLLICVAIFTVCIVIREIIHPVIISGSSMEPTYHHLQVLTSKMVRDNTELSYGDVVAFKGESTDKKYFIKRIAGLPGDTVQIRGGVLYINGTQVHERYDRMEEGGLAEEPVKLKENEYFMLGDNRNNSKDSRFIGPVERQEIRYLINQPKK